ncbi:hypothetical protein MHYP_G00112900 [Metynnis hypsauchen]
MCSVYLICCFVNTSTMKTVFVTVGSTCFDDLIASMTSDEVVKALVDRGYTDVVLQVGRGSFVPDPQSCPGLRLEAFRFKESIAENIQLADLVISHAGAGSCLEALGAGKPLLVVVNDKLMDNHQLELAKQLQVDSHLLYCTCSTLPQTLRDMDLSALLPFQRGCLSRIHSSKICTNQDCMVDISCMVINLEYVHCSWTRLQMQDMSYNFSSAFRHADSYQECPQYLQENGQNVACRIPLPESGQFVRFYTKLSLGGNLTVKKDYAHLTERVKINPPFNLSVNLSANNELCLYWVNNVSQPLCVEFMIRYLRGSDQWKVSDKQQSTFYCISFVFMGDNFTFQVKSRIGNHCGTSDFWSEWSAPLQWGNCTESNSAPLSQSRWHLWLSILGVIVLIALAVLLCYVERVKVLILPVVPDPSKNLQDLFYKHNGNVESWVHVSRELQEAFHTDYAESPCVVCEPSPTLKSKECDKPVQQHYA